MTVGRPFKPLPLSNVYQQIEPGPVAMLTTAHKGRANVMTMSWHMMTRPAAQVAAPLIAECFVNLECRVFDSRLVRRYNLFILEVLAAWRDPAQKNPKTIHHHGYGNFVTDGAAFHLKSRMR
jgi:flavin reductase (DIM6/NTAB) family NADH-FMN oxidoreductase RutF